MTRTTVRATSQGEPPPRSHAAPPASGSLRPVTPVENLTVPATRTTEATRRRIAMLRWSALGIAGATAIAIFAQAMFGDVEELHITFTTLWWCLGACVVATLLVDRFIHTPAAEGGIWIVFSTAAVFVGLVVVFGATHALYSRATVALLFVSETCWLIAGANMLIRNRVLRLGVCEAETASLLSAAQAAVAGSVTDVRAELVASKDLATLATLDGVVIDRFTQKDDATKRLISSLKLGGVRIYSADHVHELLTGRLSLQQTEDSFLDDSPGTVLYGLLKRVLDVAGACILLVVLGVPMLVIAVAIRATSSGPALFRQRRVGVHGSTFEMLKFRTMRAIETLDGPIAETPEQARSRVTPLGQWLRTFRLDELPQLLNVLAGTMSLIGPRPEWTATAGVFVDCIAHYPYRHLVRPGITGWAQVNQGHVTDVEDARIKLEYDLYYVKHLSFALDVVIGIRTIRTVVTGYGAR